MFIKYQKIRNTTAGATTAVVASVAAFFGFRGGDDPSEHRPEPGRRQNTVAQAQRFSEVVRDQTPPPVIDTPAETPPVVTLAEPENMPVVSTVEAPSPESAKRERYRLAMKIATSPATADGKGKDVLGPASPWKLNLYDDDRDGQWDRGKLDYDRDEIDDEKWNFKLGRWEKDGGRSIWMENRWVSDAISPDTTEQVTSPAAHADSTSASDQRYRQAMKFAHARATGAKGKDVLGPSSPWKLNLYDDDTDGQWDRAKLDRDRDDVDDNDEKWNFKDGRWEKDGGDSVWNGQQWEPAS